MYLLFFFSGISGLIYEVVWVRMFGNLFGNTIYSAAIVTSVFMLGLGLGSYIAGIWSDSGYKKGKALKLFRTYGYAELGIAILGLLIALTFPVLEGFSGSFASYAIDARGWHHLSLVSHLSQFLAAIILMLPVTTLMGATLSLLIRQLVAEDVKAAGWRIGVLYGFNTAGAALGCFCTDLFLVPMVGLLRTQLLAIAINITVGFAAIFLTKKAAIAESPLVLSESADCRSDAAHPPFASGIVMPIALALFFSGFASMGMEIVWFRFLSACLGGFRVVFSLLLTVILVGIWLGSLAGGYSVKRWGKPVERYMLVQAIFIFSTPLLLVAFNGSQGEVYLMKRILQLPSAMGLSRLTQIWGIARPILAVIGLPSFLIGFSFPLANAVVQRLERHVGRRAGGLYLANTLGAVLGALVAGFMLLPGLGSQRSVLVLCFASCLVLFFLQIAKIKEQPALQGWPRVGLFIGCIFIACAILIPWSLLPANYLTIKSFPSLSAEQRILTTSEGLNEMLMVIDNPSGKRNLFTNGHSMSGTNMKLQRYMRAFVHLPLLQMADPQSVLVICFGVGNTVHAASLHPTIRRLDIVDLSEQILNHASYFRDSNRDVLADKRVAVFINDGRLHLQMMPPAHYDLITLEPPPISFAGVSSLYSREFYELARSRLKRDGFVTQWMPLYQVSPAVSLSMVRAFLDVFPNAVMLSGMHKELILMGRESTTATFDPNGCSANLARAPLVQSDLQRIHMGTLTEIVGTFVANSADLHQATRKAEAVTDDNRSMEYGMISKFGETGLPAELFKVNGVAAWCPDCFANGKPRSIVAFLDKYLAALNILYRSDAFLYFRQAWGSMAGSDIDFIDPDGSLGAIVSRYPYLQEVLASPLTGSMQKIVFRNLDGPWSIQGVNKTVYPDAVTNIRIAMKQLRSNFLPDSIQWFKRAVALDERNVSARFGLGYALFCAGELQGAIAQYWRGLEIAPDNVTARLSLATAFHQAGRLNEEKEQLQHILGIEPECSEAADRLNQLK